MIRPGETPLKDVNGLMEDLTLERSESSNLNDAQLVELTRRRDRGAFTILVERYEKKLYQTAVAILGNPADAEDVAQEAFVVAYYSIDELRDDSRLGSWLYGITLRLSRNLQRSRAKRNLGSINTDETGTHPALTDAEATLPARRRELAQKIDDHIKSLPPKQRVAVALRHVHGYSYSEIGRFMGMPVSSVKGVLFRATQALRGRLHNIFQEW